MGEGIQNWIVDMIDRQMDRVHGWPIQGPHMSAIRGIRRDRQVVDSSGKEKDMLKSFECGKVVKAVISCMQGWRWKQAAGDETGIQGENQACKRRDFRVHLEITFNDSEGEWYVIQAYLSLDMESMLQEWRLVWHQMVVVSNVSREIWFSLLLLMFGVLLSAISTEYSFWPS